ncbi:MAG: hypothetical protein KGZ83_19500 [Sulfuricella sp.]|nr:hypothetical protein [Sulfuricella sp.]
MLENGQLLEIRFSDTPGKAPLTNIESQYFRELVNNQAMEIVQKWVDFFVLRKNVTPTVIARRLK